MSERIIYLFHDPRFTPHEMKWGAGGGCPEGWIYFQQEIKETLEKLLEGKCRDEIVALLQSREMRYEEHGDGTLIVWLDTEESFERREVRELEDKINDALAKQMKKVPRQSLLRKPSSMVVRQMAKAAMAVYLAAIDHPLIYE